MKNVNRVFFLCRAGVSAFTINMLHVQFCTPCAVSLLVTTNRTASFDDMWIVLLLFGGK